MGSSMGEPLGDSIGEAISVYGSVVAGEVLRGCWGERRVGAGGGCNAGAGGRGGKRGTGGKVTGLALDLAVAPITKTEPCSLFSTRMSS
mmetsp:Transcript_99267/g.221813  ORF Transcript_99267/g.221813 Transcript_99267/m.221813 type:complete len:89 (+) Transcript_99267:143-409(+)